MSEEKKENRVVAFLKARATFIRYCIVGAAATLLETGLYMLLYEKLGIYNVISTFVAWFLTVLFAFLTNKYFVYRSNSGEKVIKELLSFFSCRIGTGIFNLVWMYVTVDLLDWTPLVMKLLSALMVGIINYLVGKVMIFKKK
ncbi:MAG: GtrA family protein [Candidatus Ornithospirochaeta sp.]